VKASPGGLLIECRSAWRKRATLVSADDIRDLDCSTFEGALESARKPFEMSATPGGGTERLFARLERWVPTKGITVKSRRELITFGEGLPAGELQYLSWVLRKTLISR
jgi:hypothetical protein